MNAFILKRRSLSKLFFFILFFFSFGTLSSEGVASLLLEPPSETVDLEKEKKNTQDPFFHVAQEDDKTACIRFNVPFLEDLLTLSQYSQVPFLSYRGKPRKPMNRIYPRLSKDPIRIGPLYEKTPSLGGRERLGPQEAYTMSALYEDLFGSTRQSPYILADLMILHKRAYVKEVLNQDACQSLTYLNLPNHHTGRFPHPLLCAYFVESVWAKVNRGCDMGFSRLMQAIFTATLSQKLLLRGYPIQVLAREGFGGILPSSADLGNGLRLDPGLLPLATASIVAETLKELDRFLADVFVMENSQNPKKKKEWKHFQWLINELNSYQDCAGKLMLVDRIVMQVAAQLEHHGTLRGTSLLKIHEQPQYICLDRQVALYQEQRSFVFTVKVKARAILSPRASPVKERKFFSDYGSSSEEEFEHTKNGPRYIMRKVALVSGMAAINLSDWLACRYSISSYMRERGLFAPGGPMAGPLKPHHPYFELSLKLAKWREHLIKKRELSNQIFKGIHHVNAAPNPRNKEGDPLNPASLVEIIDVTNVPIVDRWELVHERTSQEDTPEALKPLRLLLLVSSGSKYPTGGDLVFGEIILVGPASVVNFCTDMLMKHLDHDKKSHHGRGSTVLQSHEHELRRTLNDCRLRRRVRDFRSVAKVLGVSPFPVEKERRAFRTPFSPRVNGMRRGLFTTKKREEPKVTPQRGAENWSWGVELEPVPSGRRSRTRMKAPQRRRPARKKISIQFEDSSSNSENESDELLEVVEVGLEEEETFSREKTIDLEDSALEETEVKKKVKKKVKKTQGGLERLFSRRKEKPKNRKGRRRSPRTVRRVVRNQKPPTTEKKGRSLQELFGRAPLKKPKPKTRAKSKTAE